MVKGEDFVEDFESAVGGFVSFLERSSDEIDIIVEEYADSSARGRNGQWKSDVLNLSLGWSKARRVRFSFLLMTSPIAHRRTNAFRKAAQLYGMQPGCIPTSKMLPNVGLYNLLSAS